jgi:hypothetical protein
MSRNLAAYTIPGGGYPAYVSINEDSDGVQITVRSPSRSDGTCGDCATITLRREVFDELLSAALRR